jgi:uncharacterized protein YdaU (DUF1376 family)
MNYWQRGEPLPNNDTKLSRIVRMAESEWLEIRDDLAEFFDVADGFWSHGRIDRELCNVRDKSTKAKDAAGKRWKSERNANAMPTHSERNADAMRTQCHTDTDTDTDTELRQESASPALAADAAPPCPAEQIVELFNARCPALPAVRTLTDQRRKAIRARWRESPERQDTAWWANLFTDVSRSTFLTGANDRNWCADFDWLMKPGNLVKVSEGKYLGPSNPLAQFSKLTQANIRAGVEFLNG